MKLIFCDICGCDKETKEFVVTPMHVIYNRPDIDFYKYDKNECIVSDLCESCANVLNEKYKSFNQKIFKSVLKQIEFENNKILKGETNGEETIISPEDTSV